MNKISIWTRHRAGTHSGNAGILGAISGMLKRTIILLACALLLGVVIFVLVESFSWLDAHNAIITALATVLLAIITLGLVWSGVQQHKTTRAQLRAYLSVIIGTAVYQERDKNFRFEAKPAIVNNGQTPAYNVRYRIKADIFTDSVAASYTFREPPDVDKKPIQFWPP